VADSDGWQSGSVADQLYHHPARFTFLQAVRLLEEIELRKDAARASHPGRCKVPGEAAHADDELLLFSHRIRLDAPPSDVEAIERRPDGDPPLMTTNVLGLAGALGPLPHTITEALLEQLRHGKRAFAAFLDIFNHRLISLFYRARKKYRPALDPRAPHDGRVARVLYALLGLGTPSLQGRALRRETGDRPLLAYAGLFAERYRSATGLERIIEDYFGVEATVVPFIGQWEELEEDDLTAIGARSGRNNRLGKTALVGRRIWNQAARFEVRLGPLDFDRFRSFLPGANDAFEPLVSLIHFYAHEELAFNIRLVLDAGQMPALTFRRQGGAALGYDTWIRGRWPPDREDDQVRLVGQR